MSKHVAWGEVERLAHTIASRSFNDRASTSFDCGDLVQHALLAVWQEFPADEQGVTVPSIRVLTKALSRRIIDALRKHSEQRRTAVPDAAVSLEAAAALPVAAPPHLDAALDFAALRAGLQQLDERTAFVLAAQAYGYSSSEIGAHLGLHSSRVRHLQSTGRAQLCDVCPIDMRH